MSTIMQVAFARSLTAWKNTVHALQMDKNAHQDANAWTAWIIYYKMSKHYEKGYN